MKKEVEVDLLEQNSAFKKSIQKIKRRKLIFWLITPIALVSTVAGATYFAIKNSKISTKTKITLSEFKNKAKGIKLSSNLMLNQLIDNIVKNYELNKNKMLNGEDFDIHKFISTYISNNLSFLDQKQINFKYLDLKKYDDNSFEITYEVTLNYKNMDGGFESNKIKGTPRSKYYFKSKQKVSLNLSSEELSNNEKLNNLIKNNIEKFKQIIRKRKDPNDTKGDKWFASDDFRKEIWDLFKQIFKEANTYPLTYPQSEYEIDKYLGSLKKDEEDNAYKYVEWNPNKGLNSLTIDFCYKNKKNNTKHNQKRWILTIEDI